MNTKQNIIKTKCVYNGTGVLRTPLEAKETLLITEVSLFPGYLYTFILEPQLPIVMEVSLFSSIHNGRFHCTYHSHKIMVH